MAAWAPGDPWPSGTPGGAAAPRWGGYVRLWLQAAIAAGRPFIMGPDANDKLDAGNVLSGGAVSLAGRAAAGESLWIDLTCDTIDVEITGGASGSQGIFSKADAATCTITLADPQRIYDPLNGHSPYAYGGHSRLVPGIPVEAFAEVAYPDGTWVRHYLFTGTADSWGEDWTPNPSERRCTLIATDVTKQFVRMDRPEQNATGQGDTVQERIHRIVEFFDWSGEVIDPPGGSTIRLQSTTLAQSAWEMLNRTTDDEIGYVYFDPEGRLRWINRQTWETIPDPVLTLACKSVGGVHDVLIDASPSTVDLQLRNAVYASRVGGNSQEAVSQSSIDRFGRYEYKRTDLGLATNVAVGEWAQYVVVLYAYPQVTLADVTMLPAIADASWEVWDGALGLLLILELVRIIWAAPDRPADEAIDSTNRVVGYTHRISRDAWEITWQLIAASYLEASGAIFHMGPHAQDRLDSGYVLSFTTTGSP